MGRSWLEAFLRWPEIDLSVFSWSGVFRWSELDLAGMAPSWAQLDFSILDRILWSFVTAVESVALVAMLCFFLAFCGCSI